MSQTLRMVDRPGYGALESANLPITPSVVEDTTGFTPPTGLTEFKRQAGVEAVAQARVAGRVNAAAVPEDEVNALYAERALLIEKKYESSLTSAEERRLTYVRWSLDRIEDARFGMSLDVLENRVADYENFFTEIRSLNDRIANIGRNSSL